MSGSNSLRISICSTSDRELDLTIAAAILFSKSFIFWINSVFSCKHFSSSDSESMPSIFKTLNNEHFFRSSTFWFKMQFSMRSLLSYIFFKIDVISRLSSNLSNPRSIKSIFCFLHLKQGVKMQIIGLSRTIISEMFKFDSCVFPSWYLLSK